MKTISRRRSFGMDRFAVFKHEGTKSTKGTKRQSLESLRVLSAFVKVRHIFAVLMLLCCLANNVRAESRPAVLVVVGASGEDQFSEQFQEWAGRWEAAAKQAKADISTIGVADLGEKADRDVLQERLSELGKQDSEPLWLVLIGHGTFDGKTARYNLRGPDITAAELAGWLKEIQRPLVVLDCTSSSGPFLNELSAANRVIVTATRSGFEYNFARLGDYLSSAMTNLEADLDKDDQVSLLEAFLFAAAGVKEFYDSEGRLATEHALIDDNGDKLGTPADWFKGLRATKTAKDGATLDGLRAGQIALVKSSREQRLSPEQRVRRDELERQLAAIRQDKAKLPEDEYLVKIEPILLELGRLYQRAERGENAP
jgi:hypothetical protein